MKLIFKSINKENVKEFFESVKSFKKLDEVGLAYDYDVEDFFLAPTSPNHDLVLFSRHAAQTRHERGSRARIAGLHRRGLPRGDRPDGPRALRHHRLGLAHPYRASRRWGLRRAAGGPEDEGAGGPGGLAGESGGGRGAPELARVEALDPFERGAETERVGVAHGAGDVRDGRGLPLGQQVRGERHAPAGEVGQRRFTDQLGEPLGQRGLSAGSFPDIVYGRSCSTAK